MAEQARTTTTEAPAERLPVRTRRSDEDLREHLPGLEAPSRAPGA